MVIFSNGVVAQHDQVPAGVTITTSKEPQEFPGWAGTAQAVTIAITKDQENPLLIEELINGDTHVSALHITIAAGVSAKVNIMRLHQMPGKSGTTRTVDVARDANLAVHEFDLPVLADQPELVGISLVQKPLAWRPTVTFPMSPGVAAAPLVRHSH